MRASIVAFVVMVIAFVTVDIMVMRSLDGSRQDFDLASRVGSQRRRAEGLAKDALLLVNANSEAEADRARTEFDWNLTDLVSVHRNAMSADVQSRLRDVEVQNHSSLWPPVLNSFQALEKAAIAFRAETNLSHRSQRARDAAVHLSDLSRAFVRSMGELVDVMTVQNESAIEGTRRTALFMLAMFILTLIGQAVYIFRPVLRRVHATLEQVQALQNQIEGQNGLLSERNRNLEDQRRKLDEQRVELEAQNEKLRLSQDRLEEQRAALAKQNHETQKQKNHLEELAGSLEAAKDLQAQAARRAEDLFQGVPVACFSFDQEGTLHAWNREAVELYGYAAHEVLFRPMWETLGHPDAEPGARSAIDRVFVDEQSSISEWLFTRPDGQQRIVQTKSFPIRDANGRVVAGIGTTLDLTERRRYEAELEQNSQDLQRQKLELEEANVRLSALASTDGLTGLTNHRAFQELLESEFEVSVREGQELTVVLSDVDNFKKLNDEHGHPVGDRVLQQVARVLRDESGAHGIACRYGGEEFVAILPNVGADQGLALAESMRAAIEQTLPDGLYVTASFGVASWSPTTRSKAELIAQADKALYSSKRAGRNRVTHARDFMADDDRSQAA